MLLRANEIAAITKLFHFAALSRLMIKLSCSLSRAGLKLKWFKNNQALVRSKSTQCVFKEHNGGDLTNATGASFRSDSLR